MTSSAEITCETFQDDNSSNRRETTVQEVPPSRKDGSSENNPKSLRCQFTATSSQEERSGSTSGPTEHVAEGSCRAADPNAAVTRSCSPRKRPLLALLPPPGAQRRPDEQPAELPLSPDDVSKFEEDGFVLLKRAFDPKVAAACRESLWRRLRGEGIRRDDPSTWVGKVSLDEIYGIPSSPRKRRGRPWKDALSPRLKSAVNQLLGADAWEEFGCGWWMITFPGFSQPPWGVEGKWHCDGAHFRHYPHSREIGLLPIFLFSDVHPHGGGTAVIRGSHKTVAEIVWKRAGTTGLTGGPGIASSRNAERILMYRFGPELSSAAREQLLPVAGEDMVETIGSAGDVLLTHPLLLHARSTNLAPVEESGVRFMCHPAVPLKCHLDLNAPPETFSVLGRTMWQARPSSAGSYSSVLKPEQCDHTPVKLQPMPKQGSLNKRPRRARPHEHQRQRQRQLDLDAGGGSPGSAVTDMAVRGELPGAEAISDFPNKQNYSSSGHVECPTCVVGEEDANSARDLLDPRGPAEEVDVAVMEVMGFCSFGSLRG